MLEILEGIRNGHTYYYPYDKANGYMWRKARNGETKIVRFKSKEDAEKWIGKQKVVAHD